MDFALITTMSQKLIFSRRTGKFSNNHGLARAVFSPQNLEVQKKALKCRAYFFSCICEERELHRSPCKDAVEQLRCHQPASVIAATRLTATPLEVIADGSGCWHDVPGSPGSWSRKKFHGSSSASDFIVVAADVQHGTAGPVIAEPLQHRWSACPAQPRILPVW